MKKSKLLIPLLTISGAAAIVAPIMTSCSQGETEEQYFSLSKGEKAKVAENPEIAGQLEFAFSTNKDFDAEAAKLVEPIAVITSNNSYITINRCWKQSFESKTLSVIVSYTINPEAYTYKEVEGKKAANEKVEFDFKIHNGSWTQTIKGFSIEAQRLDK